jgi:hypothetical protein
VANQYSGAPNYYLPISAGCIGAADVSCTSGAETNVIASGTIKTPIQGDFYPLISGNLVIYMGATAPTALVIAFRIGAGADVATYTVDPGQLVNSAKVQFAFGFVGANSASAWFPTGSTLNVTVNPTGQTVTVKNVGSFAIFELIQGPNI